MSAPGPELWKMNAFTDRPFSGNPCGVVLDADALDAEQMQRLAPELNSVSETVFVCRAQVPEADLRLRYFTATTEVDLCGHATISALFALAAAGRLAPGAHARGLRAQTPVGVLTLGVRFDGARLERASMTQLPPRFAPGPGRALAAQVLGLDPAQIRADLTIGCCSTGIWSCYVPLVDLQALAAVRVARERIAELGPGDLELAGVYPYVITGRTDGGRRVHTRGRFFSPPRYGIAEDPVTGTAAGALGAQLIEHRVLDAEGVLEARQGVEMGRPGAVRVRRAADGCMRIDGQAVPVFRGHLAV